jgi:uncharacterized protein YigE (DUF2233 family)
MRLRVWSGGAFLAFALTLAAGGNTRADDDSIPPPVVSTKFRGATYATCTVDAGRQVVRIYWDDGHGNILGNFTALQKQVAAEGARLLFAANAGMFDPAGKPVGLLVQDGAEKFPLNLNDGAGNFYMKPNGVFGLLGLHRPFVIESDEYPALLTQPSWATQSGPLLVHGGDINPDFLPESKNRKIRSGVGVTAKGTAVFALSKEPVTFYELAGLFQANFHCPNALYLDGEISDFWTPSPGEKEGEHHFGPMIAVVWMGNGVPVADSGHKTPNGSP